jgi:hypothetical protein
VFAGGSFDQLSVEWVVGSIRHFSLQARNVVNIIVLVLNEMVLVFVLGYPRSYDYEHGHKNAIDSRFDAF